MAISTAAPVLLMVNGMAKEKKADVFTCKSKVFKPIFDFLLASLVYLIFN